VERVTIKQSRKAGSVHVTQRELHSKAAHMGKGKAVGKGRAQAGSTPGVVSRRIGANVAKLP